METDTKKARKWDAEKEEIDDHVEKQALEALEELKAIEAIEVVKTSLKLFLLQKINVLKFRSKQ